MNRIITTLPQLQQLQTDTYIYSAIILLVAFGVAFILANMVPYKGGNDRSYITRRVLFVIVGLVAGLGYWVYNQATVMACIRNAGFKNQFGTTTYYSLALILLGYVAVSVLVMCLSRYSKFGSILGKSKK